MLLFSVSPQDAGGLLHRVLLVIGPMFIIHGPSFFNHTSGMWCNPSPHELPLIFGSSFVRDHLLYKHLKCSTDIANYLLNKVLIYSFKSLRKHGGSSKNVECPSGTYHRCSALASMAGLRHEFAVNDRLDPGLQAPGANVLGVAAESMRSAWGSVPSTRNFVQMHAMIRWSDAITLLIIRCTEFMIG